MPDLQVPYHSKRFVKNLTSFVREWEPDMLVNVGDDIDSPEVSRWTKGSAGEYAGTLQKAFDDTREMHTGFRLALGWDKPYHLSRSNHGDRLHKYINRYAPALASLQSLRINELAGYTDLGIQYHTRPFAIAPGWVCSHGDEGSLSRIPGKTALSLAQKWGVSVVCGHTHRAGLVPHSSGLNARLSTLWGMEVGHGMDVSKAGYLSAGSADWQSAFGIIHVRGSRVYPSLVPVMNDGSFCVDGIFFPEYTDRLDSMKGNVSA